MGFSRKTSDEEGNIFRHRGTRENEPSTEAGGPRGDDKPNMSTVRCVWRSVGFVSGQWSCLWPVNGRTIGGQGLCFPFSFVGPLHLAALYKLLRFCVVVTECKSYVGKLFWITCKFTTVSLQVWNDDSDWKIIYTEHCTAQMCFHSAFAEINRTIWPQELRIHPKRNGPATSITED